MGKKKTSNYHSLWFFLFLVFLVIIAYQIKTSVFLSSRERITIAVYAERPFVLSYSKKTGMANVVFFSFDKQTFVPGGYQWYLLESLLPLGQMEGKTNQLLKATFSYLIGAPVDIVIYDSARVSATQKEQSLKKDLVTYLAEIKKHSFLFTNAWQISTNNVLDRFNLEKVFNLRFNKLNLLNEEDNYILVGSEKRYLAEKLDTKLKGYFYQDLFLNSNGKVVIYAEKKYYSAALNLERLIEGTGIKVLDIVIEDGAGKTSFFIYPKDLKVQGQLLTEYFIAKAKNGNDQFLIKFYLGKDLGEKYK